LQIENQAYPVNVEALHTVFTPYGFVQKIACFEKNNTWQVKSKLTVWHFVWYTNASIDAAGLKSCTWCNERNEGSGLLARIPALSLRYTLLQFIPSVLLSDFFVHDALLQSCLRFRQEHHHFPIHIILLQKSLGICLLCRRSYSIPTLWLPTMPRLLWRVTLSMMVDTTG